MVLKKKKIVRSYKKHSREKYDFTYCSNLIEWTRFSESGSDLWFLYATQFIVVGNFFVLCY